MSGQDRSRVGKAARSWIRVACLTFFFTAWPAASQQKTVEIPPQVTPDARASLEHMKAYLNGLDRFEIDIQGSRDENLPYGYKLQRNENARMIVQRPNRLRVDVDGDKRRRSYFYDGTTLTMVVPDKGVYARTQAPDTIAGLINGLLNAGVELPLIDVLKQGYQGTLLEGVRYGLLVGDTKVDGTQAQHLAFRQPTVDWQIWIAKNGQPRKLLITTRYEVGDPQYQATLRWNLKPAIDASTFVFKPTAGMREIRFDGEGSGKVDTGASR